MSDNFNSRFVFSISKDTKKQLDMIAKEFECSSASVIRRLIKQEYSKLSKKNNKV